MLLYLFKKFIGHCNSSAVINKMDELVMLLDRSSWHHHRANLLVLAFLCSGSFEDAWRLKVLWPTWASTGKLSAVPLSFALAKLSR